MKRPRVAVRAAKKPEGTHHHGDLVRALKETALDEIARGGLDGLSLRSISRRVGVTHSAAYRHFASLDALLDELAADGFVALAEVVSSPEVTRELGPEGLVAIGRAYVRFALERPATFTVMFSRGAPMTGRHATLDRATDVVVERLSEAARIAGPALGWDSPRDLGIALWAMGHGLAVLIETEQVRARSIERAIAYAEVLLRKLFAPTR